MPKKQNAAAKENENFVYLFLVVFLIEMVAVWLLHTVQTYYTYITYMDAIAAAAGWIALAGAAAGVISLAAACVTGKRPAAWLGGLLILLAACAGLTWMYYTDGVTMSYALVIGAGVLYLAAQIYPPENQTLAGLSILAAICYYGISRYSGSRVCNGYTIPLTIALAVILVLALVCTALAKNGELALGALRLRLWAKRESRLLIYLSCLVWAALLALIFLLGATFAWYCVLVAVVVLFALAVWFTIKLM